MGKYLHKFNAEEDFNAAYNGADYREPWVSYTEGVGRVDYNKTEDEKLLGTPFTIEALGSGNITWSLSDKTVQYSKNNGPWETMDGGTTISVVGGDEVRFKGVNTDYNYCTILATMQFKVKGNIMSLTNGDEFYTANTVNSYGFSALFNGCTYLVSASDLKLPATTLVGRCYQYMFEGCTSLTTAPELPATTLASNCYYSMFQDCTSLTQAPELPATTLASGCYEFMFTGCISLAIAPELPATTLASNCYRYMFNGCTSLATAPELPSTTLVTECYWGMFQDCTSLTQAPELPATTLAEYCYFEMFLGCTNLNYIKCLATNISASDCTYNWVSGVQTSSGTFVKAPSMTDWPTGENGVPTGWTVETATA